MPLTAKNQDAEPQRRDAITVMVATSGTHGLPMTKGWRRNGNEYEKTYTYPRGYLFNFQETSFSSIADFLHLFEAAGKVPTVCFCLGKLKDGQEIVFNARRLLVELHPGEGVLTRDASTLIPLDFDRLELPDGMALTDTTAIIEFALSQLPREFRNVSFVWQLTPSHLVSGNARVRLYFLANRDLFQKDLDVIFADIPVDPAVFRPAQIIYVVQPSFEGTEDPVPERSGFVKGGRERVEIGPLIERSNAQEAFSGRQKKDQKTGAGKSGVRKPETDAKATAKAAMKGLSFEQTLACIGDHQPGGHGFDAPINRAIALGIGRFRGRLDEFDAKALEEVIADRIWKTGRCREHIEERLADLPNHIGNLLNVFRREEAARGKVFRDPPGVIRPSLTLDTAAAAIVAPIESFFAKAADAAIDEQHAACTKRGVTMPRMPGPFDMYVNSDGHFDDHLFAKFMAWALREAAMRMRKVQTMILSDLGVGKTRAATRGAIRFVNGDFVRPGEQPPVPLRALFCVNDHRLAREVAATLSTQESGIATVWLGLKQPRHADQPDGETMCKRTEDAEMWIEAGGRMEGMCIRCPFGKKAKGEERCGYSLQDPDSARIVIVAGPATLLSELSGKLKRKVRLQGKTVTFQPFDAVIVDEPKPTEWVKGFEEPIVVEITDVTGVVRPPEILRTAARKWDLKAWVEFDRLMAEATGIVGIAATLGHGDERQLTREEAEALNPGALRTLLQRLRMKPAAGLSAGTGEALAAALVADGGWNRRVRQLIALCEVAIEARKVDGGTIAPNIIAGNHANWGTGLKTGLKLRLRRELTLTARRTPTLLLDATGDPGLLQVWWPNLDVAADLRVKMPAAVRVVQVSDTLASYTGWAPLAKLPAKKTSEAVKRSYERSMGNMLRLAWLCDVVAAQVSLGLVVPKKMEAALEAAWARRGCRPAKVVIGHHGAIRGQNRFADVRVFINLSRMTPPVRDVEDLAETLTGRVAGRIAADDKGAAGYSHAEGSRKRHHIMRGGGVVACEHAEWHPDADVERIRRQLTDAEADQADGRSRGIRRGDATPLLHIRATALPSDRLEVDELVKMDAVVPFDAFDALAARGVIVPTGNSFKGGQQLLAAILSAEETLLRERQVKVTRKAVQHALSRKSLSTPNSIYSTIYADWGTERSFEAAFPHNGAPVETELRRQRETWSEWCLPRGRFAVTVFLNLPAGTAAGTAKIFLVERAFLPAEYVAGLLPGTKASEARKGRKR